MYLCLLWASMLELALKVSREALFSLAMDSALTVAMVMVMQATQAFEMESFVVIHMKVGMVCTMLPDWHMSVFSSRKLRGRKLTMLARDSGPECLLFAFTEPILAVANSYSHSLVGLLRCGRGGS